MMKAVATAVETAERATGQAPVQPLYLEPLTLVERLHRRLLDVIKDEFDRRGRALSEARQDGGAGRRHLERRVRDAQPVAAPARAVLDRPDPVPPLRSSKAEIKGQAGQRNKTGSRCCSFLEKTTLPQAHRPVFRSGALFFLRKRGSISPIGTYSRRRLYQGSFEILAKFAGSSRKGIGIMLVERGLQVMNVEVVGDAYAIASNYLRRSGALPYNLVTDERLLGLIL